MARLRSATCFAFLPALLFARAATAAPAPPAVSDTVIAQPDTVYAVNNFPDDETDQSIIGLVWTRLGLLDDVGKPAKKSATSNDLELNGAKVGEAIVQGGQVIGWRNLNGKREAYDLSGGATFADNVWPRVKAGGVIEIIKHGLSATQGSGWTNGGALHLDKKAGAAAGSKGEFYNGFTVKPQQGQDPGAGTGRLKDATAYVIPGRPDDNIKVILTVCMSNRQAKKGTDAALPSVRQTIAAIPGVASAKGYKDCATVSSTVGLRGRLPEFAYGVMYYDLAEKGKVEKDIDDEKKQQEKVNDWMKKFPTLERYDKVSAYLAQLRVDPLAGPLSKYPEPTESPSDVDAQSEAVWPAADTPMSPEPAVADTSGGTYTYADSLTGGNGPQIVIPPHALSGETEVAIHIVPEAGGSLPSGMINAASRATEFVAEGLAGPTLSANLTLVLPFGPSYTHVGFYRLSGSQWISVPSGVPDYGAHRVTLQTQTMGIYQVFSDQEPPPPSGPHAPILPASGLTAFALASALVGSRAIFRSRRRAAG
jgi:hypothetical protein